jgi:preprotein translocase subunit SecG
MRVGLTIVQVIICAVLIGLIILQAKGVGLGSSFGGSGEFYQSRRGVEKIVFNLTIIVSIVFLVVSVLRLFIKA